MKLFANIINKKRRGLRNDPQELKAFRDLEEYLRSLQKAERYIARSEYLKIAGRFKETADYFAAMRAGGTLKKWCMENGIRFREAGSVLRKFEELPSLIDAANAKYISKQLVREKKYLDDILRASDPDICLDRDQRRAVLNDEDHCLIVAGAGAGKTTTIAAKVKYLVDKRGIDPSKILLISFTNKAVDELKKRISGDLGINCPIATFHSAGYAFIRKLDPGRLNVADNARLHEVAWKYFKNLARKDDETGKRLICFCAYYSDAPCDQFEKRSCFTTMKSELGHFRRRIVDAETKKTITVVSELVRTKEEAAVANCLYLNGIDYEYEPKYPRDVMQARRPYTPDFRIGQGGKEAYIECFGVSEDFENAGLSEEERIRFTKTIKEKILLHRAHGTKLICIFSSYRDRRTLTDHLKEQLEEAGFKLRPKPQEEILRDLVSLQENRYLKKLIALICRFIVNFKINGFEDSEFEGMLRSVTDSRTRLFLAICRDCFRYYEQYLLRNHMLDFQDMINESARIFRDAKKSRRVPDYQYIIVDEYQDISIQRFDFISALKEVTNAKIIAVGDDWQSIFAFSGSDLPLFTQFARKTGHASLLKIVRTYRNSQEVIDIAGRFIQKNKTQIRKDLISDKHLKNPVIIFTYDSHYHTGNAAAGSGAVYAPAHAVETALEHIIENDPGNGRTRRKERKNEKNGTGKTAGVCGQKILLIGRFGFDVRMLTQSGLFEYEKRDGRLRSVRFPELDLTFLTAHSSKGLGFDHVIVLNGKNGTYGFPAKIMDDPVLSLLIKEDTSIEYAEERRLFYVAMTRTKNRVYFIAPKESPSEFLLELKHDYGNVVRKGRWNVSPGHGNAFRKTCPQCGYPLQLRYKISYGLRLWQCSNEPELCGYMTNDPAEKKLQVIKCGRCRDGFLIIKPAPRKGRYMLACTNRRCVSARRSGRSGKLRAALRALVSFFS